MAGSRDGRVWSDLLLVIGVLLFMAGFIIIYCAGSLCLLLISICYDGAYFICFVVWMCWFMAAFIIGVAFIIWLLGRIFWAH